MSPFGVVAVIGVGVGLSVGCGGGGAPADGDGTFVPVSGGGYETPPNSYDSPGSSLDQPPAGEETPPGGFETPPGTGSGGSAGTRRVCSSICQSLLASGCSEGSLDQAGCVESCSVGLPEAYGVCLDDGLAVIDCILRSPSFDCDALEDDADVDEGAFAECRVAALRFATCADQNLAPEEPEPGPGDGEAGAGGI